MNASMYLIRILVISILIPLVGCVEPQGGKLVGQRVSGGILLLKNPIETRDLKYADWFETAGRMDTYARTRHLAPSNGWKTLLVEEFDEVISQGSPGWQIIGKPAIRPIRLDDTKGIELLAPKDPFEMCGIQRIINPTLLAGRDVRLEVRFTCRSSRRVKALSGISLSLRAIDGSGALHTLDLPIVADVSPGWESQHYRLRFHPTIGPITIRIDITSPDTIFTIDRITLTGKETLPQSMPKSAGKSTSQPVVQPINLIAGGDFETGQHLFFTSATKYWPNGDEMSIPSQWEFDYDAVVGENSMLIHIADETGRLVFGPLDLNPKSITSRSGILKWYLSFHARVERPTTIIATLRNRKGTIEQSSFQLTNDWQRFTKTFTITARTYDERVELASTELLFDVLGDGLSKPNRCWLDAVALTNVYSEKPYIPSEPVEVGLFGPVPNPTDLSNLLDLKSPVSFGIRLRAYPAKQTKSDSAKATIKPAAESDTDQKATSTPDIKVGKLAVDVLDAWDRVVWTKTTTPIIPATGVLNDTIKLQLPRGYYRVLATLWSGEPGESKIISRANLAIATIDLNDPVPLSNMFGLSTDGANVSMRTTHIGAGWVRMDLPAHRVQIRPGLYDFTFWRLLVAQCKRAQVEIFVGLTLPKSKALWKMFLEQLFKDNEILPIGAVIHPPAISAQPIQEYANQLAWISDLLTVHAPEMKLIQYLSGWDDESASPSNRPKFTTGISGFTCIETQIPEACEPTLETLGAQNQHLWDLRVPAHIGGAPNRSAKTTVNNPLAADGPIELLAYPIDPVRSASRFVRSLLIRSLAGVEMVCSDAVVLSPVRSIYDETSRCLHEKDLSPRAALVAFDLMTSLLNDATAKRWIDAPDGSRLLYFEKDNGQAVVAAWRPFGLSPTKLGFVNLPANIKVIDCMGLPEPVVSKADRRIVEVNEIIRYLIAPADHRENLRQSLDSVKIMIDSAATNPAG
ncbi:MAG: hypothetical protein JSV03_12455 [Planctomycetota bacterium]|nr:MAG: hypothetical protein JSV03_12455 [Planctomycetota bacterium]